MRVAIIHYHLRPGGVTRVIQHALNALDLCKEQVPENESISCAVLAGEPSSDVMPVPSSSVVEALGYYSLTNFKPHAVLAELESAASKILGGVPDIWHFHNHALGKNLIVPALVHYLASQGQKVLLQPHDFAEDGRPENYRFLRQHFGDGDSKQLGIHLYPQGSHVHYALINQRDLHFLQDAGVPERQLHYLPNAVSAEVEENADSQVEPSFGKRLFFYPARAIRRKNIGELLLWAAVAGQDDVFAIARAPKNPLARPIYDEWIAFAQWLKLPVRFGLGEEWQGSFSTLLRSAHALVTTSVAEGFGLAFLEPWLLERQLVGRKLPEITDEFERTGLDLSGLYTRVRIPLDWIGEDRFRQALQVELKRVYASYGRLMQTDDVDRAFTAASSDGLVDFGRVHEPLQRLVLEHLARSPRARAEISPSSLTVYERPKLIQANKQVVEDQFHLLGYGKRLTNIYQVVAESPFGAGEALNADTLLEEFLAPERFSLLRT